MSLSLRLPSRPLYALIFLSGALFVGAGYSLKLLAQKAPGLAGNLTSTGSASPERLLPMIAVSICWLLVALAISWCGRSISYVRAPSFLLSGAGLGMLLLLAITALGLSTSAAMDSMLLLVPLVLMILWLLRERTSESKNTAPDNASPFLLRRSFRWIWYACSAVTIGALGLRLLESFTHLAFIRGDANGDEAFFWWSSTHHFAHHNFTHYLENYPARSFHPAYPLIGRFFTALVPEQFVDRALFTLPLIHGCLLWATWQAFLPRLAPWYLRWGVGVLAAALLLQHDWLYAMFFLLWYGEALAVMAVACMFYFLEEPERLAPLLLAQVAGIGALTALVKPPLAMFAPAILVAYFGLKCMTDRQFHWRERWPIFLAAFLGCVAARMLWSVLLSRAGASTSYSLNIQDLWPPMIFEGNLPKLVTYFKTYYKQCWLIFLMLSCAALMANFRRYFASWLIACGLVGSVLALYATQWKNIDDFESGGRYLIHGLLGWALFAGSHLLRDKLGEPGTSAS